MSFLKKIPRTILVVILLAIFGIARTPFEEKLGQELIEANLVVPPPGLTVLDQMGQSALMATLGGLRPLVAGFVSLQAFEHFSNKDWDDLGNAYQIITALEPREESHWVAVVWHLGINATANMQIDSKLPEFERKRRFQDYAARAIDFGEKGLKQITDSVNIRMQLAEVYREKLKDNRATARIYGEVKDLPGAPAFVERLHGYFLARTPGDEQKAYDYLTTLYLEGEHQHLPTLIHEIKKLEGMLEIPFPMRIPETDPDDNRARPQKPKPKPLPGGIIIP